MSFKHFAREQKQTIKGGNPKSEIELPVFTLENPVELDVIDLVKPLPHLISKEATLATPYFFIGQATKHGNVMLGNLC